MNSFKFTVSFRIEHPNINPDDISANLPLTPNITWMAGNERKTQNGLFLEGKYKTTYWSSKLEPKPDMELADFLESSTSILEPHKEFLDKIYSTGGRLEFFIGWFSGTNSGEVFNHQLLGKLVNLNIDLSLDVYG